VTPEEDRAMIPDSVIADLPIPKGSKENGTDLQLKTDPASPVLTGVTPGGSSVGDQAIASDIWSAIPKVGGYRTTDHRYYRNGQGPVPGVTGVLGILDKPALVQWAKKTVAEFAVRTTQSGEFADTLKGQGPEETAKWLSSLPDYVRDAAATIGSNVHLLADMASRSAMPLEGAQTLPTGFEVSEQEMTYLTAFRAFLAFLEARDAVIVSSEKMVWSFDGYGGTYDLLVRFPDSEGSEWSGLCLLDVKTSKGYYPEYALQLAAYGAADEIIIEGDPKTYPMPKIDKYGVLHLRPDLYVEGWSLVQYPVTEREYRAFLSCLDLYNWKRERRFERKALTEGAKTRVIDDPLTRQTE